MKLLIFVCLLLYAAQFTIAQTVGTPIMDNDITVIKKPLLLTMGRDNVNAKSIGEKEWNSGVMEWSNGEKEWNIGVVEYWSSVNSEKEKIGLSSSYALLPGVTNDRFSQHSRPPLFHYSDASTAPLLNSAVTPPQTEDSKIGNEIYYFLGAAALAAIIYFLVPDNQPASKPVSTFGLPVTPK